VDKWLDFYRPFFPSVEDARKFVQSCERLSPPENTAKIMMHQAQRILSLSDDIAKVRPHREALQLLFLLMCAENISKLQKDFEGEGQSRAHVRRFFHEFVSQSEQRELGNAFVNNNDRLMPALGLQDTVDLLYKVRCDVVHEGAYWEFTFHNGELPMLNVRGEFSIECHITLARFRSIVARGCINAVKSRLVRD